MKRLIKIEDVLFSDGTIERYENGNDYLEMQLMDYADTRLTFTFSGDIRVKEQKGIGLSIYESQLKRLNGKLNLRLLDDDLLEMLDIEFGVCTISLVL